MAAGQTRRTDVHGTIPLRNGKTSERERFEGGNENPKADEQKTEMRERQEEHGAVRAVRQDRRPAAAGV